MMAQSTDAEVKATIETAQAKVNALWKTAHLPKFSRDQQGAHRTH